MAAFVDMNPVHELLVNEYQCINFLFLVSRAFVIIERIKRTLLPQTSQILYIDIWDRRKIRSLWIDHEIQSVPYVTYKHFYITSRYCSQLDGIDDNRLTITVAATTVSANNGAVAKAIRAHGIAAGVFAGLMVAIVLWRGQTKIIVIYLEVGPLHSKITSM